MPVITNLIPSGVTNRVAKTLAAFALVAASGAATAHPTPSTQATPTGPVGEVVDHIRFARLIDSFTALDNKRIVLTKSQNQHYLLHLKRDCSLLPYTQHIGFSSDMGTVRAGWDSVFVQGQHCSIQRIDRLSRADFNLLRGHPAVK